MHNKIFHEHARGFLTKLGINPTTRKDYQYCSDLLVNILSKAFYAGIEESKEHIKKIRSVYLSDAKAYRSEYTIQLLCCTTILSALNRIKIKNDSSVTTVINLIDNSKGTK